MLKIVIAGRCVLMGAVSVMAMAATAAYAAPPSYDGDYTGTNTSVDGAITGAVSVVDGDASVAPNEVTTTTTGTVTTTTTTAPAAPIVTPITVNDTAFDSTVDFSASGTSDSTVTTVRVDTFDPDTLDIIDTDITQSSAPVEGSAVVSALAVTGYAGDADENGTLAYGSTLSSSGTPTTEGSVTVTENSVLVTSSGATYATYTGTATYDPSSGTVSVAMNATPTAQTSVTSAGVTTTGNVTAGGNITATGGVSARTFTANVGGAPGDAAIDAGGGRITNVANGTAATDAINLGQLNSAVASLNDTMSAGFRDARKRAEAGTAVAVAMGGAAFLPGHKFNLTANVGTYKGETAIAGQIGVLVRDNIALNAGVATSFNDYGGTAARGGITVGF